MKPDIRNIDEVTDLERLSLQSFSYSRLNAFDWCQAQFFYNYILKIPQEYSPKALLGNVIHKALEITIVDGEKIDKAELIENYYDARDEYDPDGTVISDELFEEGFPMLEAFLARHGSGKAKITEAEHAFEFVFHGVLFRGYIDYMLVTDDKVIIRDYKSGAYEVAEKNVHMDLQLGIYALYAKHIYPDKQIDAGLHYLRSDMVKSHLFSDEDLENTQARLRVAVDGVREHNNFLPLPKNLSWKCKMCSYQKDGTCKAGRFNVEQSLKAKNRSIGSSYEYD